MTAKQRGGTLREEPTTFVVHFLILVVSNYVCVTITVARGKSPPLLIAIKNLSCGFHDARIETKCAECPAGRLVRRFGGKLTTYGLMISADCSCSFCAFSCDMKNVKLFCTRPVRKETSSGPGSPSPTCSATARASFARSARPVSKK